MSCQTIKHTKEKVEIILELHRGLVLLFSKKHPRELCMQIMLQTALFAAELEQQVAQN